MMIFGGDPISLKEISEKYFAGRVLEKNLVKFTQTTPQGNVIEGYISQEPNRYLGSFIIERLNGEDVNQFVQSMPKIHFYKDETDICDRVISRCYEKLDGTCLIIYPLKDNNGKIIEIVAKTRNNVVADDYFLEMFDRIDRQSINDYYSKNDGILIFELYGALNPHGISYDEDIDIKLIAVYEDSGFVISNENFEKSDLVFTLEHRDNWIVNVTSGKFAEYFDNDEYVYITNRDAINGIYDLLDELNERYETKNGKKAIEGVVVNTLNAYGHPKWIKIKPGMGNRDKILLDDSIKKEVLKYFDEYGSQVLKLYHEDENHHMEFICRMLEEEYPGELIEESKCRIEEIFIEVWNGKVHENINTICEDLIDDYAGRGIDYCMNIFERKYPMKRKESDKVRKLLEEKMVRYGFDI